jgi:glycosyltransferase involved in cell wall biosynthesis
MSPEPTVSVIVNTLNRREHLWRLLTELHEQTYGKFEVVVVNGPSDDGTGEMLTALAGSIRLGRCDRASLGMSRNVGLALAAGDIVAFIDDDATPCADWLEQLVAAYCEPTVVGVGGPVFDVPLNRVDWRLCTCTRLGVPNTDSIGGIERYTAPDADPIGYLPGCNMSFRRDALFEVDGFNALLFYNYDDVEICTRLIDRGHALRLLDEVLVRHYRASNAARDSSQELIDPYPALYCRTVFAMQCRQPARSFEKVISALQATVTEMAGGANDERRDGDDSRGENSTLIARLEAAVGEGVAAGRQQRVGIASAPAKRDLFRRYGGS